MLDILAAPLVAGIVLSGILAYLGLHVISRGVIFVDLALAQLAALGATVAFLFGYPFHSPQAVVTSLGFTLAGAAVFAATRMREEKVPQEAIIGIVYAVSAAAAILVISRASEGAEHIKDMLVGNILVVTWPEIGKMAGLYAAVGLVHWFARRPFLSISLDPEGSHARGLRIRWWDFLFYATFGVVVTSAVEVAGVLLVFTYLVVPSVCGAIWADGIGARLAVGWAMGAVVTLLGAAASFRWDLPTGATIAVTFGASLALAALIRRVVPHRL